MITITTITITSTITIIITIIIIIIPTTTILTNTIIQARWQTAEDLVRTLGPKAAVLALAEAKTRAEDQL